MSSGSFDSKERVKQAVDIVDLVGSHIQLRRQGRNYVGLCPFHGEKTPSFNVSREKGTYYCFGCKRGGDAIGATVFAVILVALN